MRATALVAAAVALLTFFSARAADDQLQPLQPTAADLSGLVAVGPSQFCASGEALTAIYDGGYQRFVKAGVTRASKSYYTLDGALAEIVVHQMTTAQAGEAFLADLCKDIHAKVESSAHAKICTKTSAGTSYGYVASNLYLASVSLDKEDAAKVGALLQACARRMVSQRPQQGKKIGQKTSKKTR